MKKISLFLSVFIIVIMACEASVNLAPVEIPTAASTPIPANDSATVTPEVFISLTQAIPSTAMPTQRSFEGMGVSVYPLSLTLPTGLISGVGGHQIPRADGPNLPTWGKTPGHFEIKLEGYLLQGKFHEPTIYIYPAQAYAELVPAAFESMHRLRNVMNLSAPISADQLPAIPFFNAAQVFASNVQAISFQNGNGVRFLTEYAQYAAPVNNHELVYHFQGFTSDGNYYVVALLPITAPTLAETNDVGAALPQGGIPYPYLVEGIEADMETYYAAIADVLNRTPSDAFTPNLALVDAMTQSMRVTP